MTMLKVESSTAASAHLYSMRARLTAGQRVSRKYRRQQWKRECRNLKAIVPSVANKNVSEVCRIMVTCMQPVTSEYKQYMLLR